jgi:putative addiction module component (TIGR02574 family)
MDAILLEREALQLPASERALLADKLLQSLPGGNGHAADAWSLEAERRLEAFERGEIETCDGPEAVSRIRAGLR